MKSWINPFELFLNFADDQLQHHGQVLSFQKAATNTADFIEFDVHVTSNGIVVVHHDFDVSLAVGRETISLGIPTLTYAQLSRHALALCHPPPPNFYLLRNKIGLMDTYWRGQ